MKTILIFLGFIFTSVSNNCDVVKASLSDLRIVNYLHPELSQRSRLYLVKNEYCNLNEKLGGISIETVDEKTAVKRKNFVKITSLKEEKDKLILSMVYPIENAVFVVSFDKKHQITSVDVIEK